MELKGESEFEIFNFPDSDFYGKGGICKSIKGPQQVYKKPLIFARQLMIDVSNGNLSEGFKRYIGVTSNAPVTSSVVLDGLQRSMAFSRLLVYFKDSDVFSVAIQKANLMEYKKGKFLQREPVTFIACLLTLFPDMLVKMKQQGKWKMSAVDMFAYILRSYMTTNQLWQHMQQHMTELDHWCLGLGVPLRLESDNSLINTTLEQLTGDGLVLTTTFQYFSEVKRKLEMGMEAGYKVMIRKYIQLSPELYASYLLNVQNKTQTSQRNVQSVKPNLLWQLATHLEKSRFWIDKVLLLQLSTGSRFIEALLLSKYTPSEANNNIIITGVAKKRNEGEKFEVIAKPVLFITNKQVVNLKTQVIDQIVNRELLRMKIDKSDLKKVSALFAPLANSRLRTLVPDTTFTTHSMRKLYANYSYHLFGQTSGLTNIAWINDVLGHSTNSLHVALSYNNIRIV
jgi:hypothetical protein